jgi:hypothetical protein
MVSMRIQVKAEVTSREQILSLSIMKESDLDAGEKIIESYSRE